MTDDEFFVNATTTEQRVICLNETDAELYNTSFLQAANVLIVNDSSFCPGLNANEDANSADDFYNIPVWRQTIWVLLFVVMATVATSGNLIVIWIVLSQQRMRTVTNYFIGNYRPYVVFLIENAKWLPERR